MPKELNSITFRKVTEETFNDLLDLIAKLAEYEKLSPPYGEARNRLKRDCLSDKPKYQAFIGKIGDKPVSYFIYFFTYSSFLALPTLFIEDLFVLEEHRRKEIGKKMFDLIKEIAKREGCGRIEFIVLEWNKSAQQFYVKNGAERMDWYLYRIKKENF